MTETGKVHLLTRIPGRDEAHVLGMADLTYSLEVLMQQLGKIWDIDDMSGCVLEYSGALLDSPGTIVIIGTDEEWTFARDQFRNYIDSRSSRAVPKVPASGYDRTSGYGCSCKTRRAIGPRTCPVCRPAATTTSAPPQVQPRTLVDTIPILIRRKPSKPSAAELEVLSADQKTAKLSTLTKQLDELVLSTKQTEIDLKAQCAAFDARIAELDESKTANTAQSEVLTANKDAYLRETEKSFASKEVNEKSESSIQGSAGVAPSVSSVGDFDVVDDGESTA